MSKLEDVEEFHKKMKFYPHCLSSEMEDGSLAGLVTEKRIKIIQEEFRELCDAIKSQDLPAILHESVDAIYVVLGALHELGVSQNNLDAAWEMVHAANMKKKIPLSPLDKAVKSDKWEKADVSKAMSIKFALKKVLICYSHKGIESNMIVSAESPISETRVNQILGSLESVHENEKIVILNLVELS